MRWASACSYPVTKRLDTLIYDALATSVAASSANGRIGIAMTHWNPVFQFLCCEDSRYQAVLQRSCWLDCALEELDAGDETRIIVIVG